MSQLRKLQRNIKRDLDITDVPTDHLKLPVGQVTSAPVKGEFLALPLFGWVGLRRQTDTPLVMVVALLMREGGDPSPRGTIQLELPVFEDTELATLGVLERFGWDGRVWPTEEGWPSGITEEEIQLRALMDQAGLQATLTFPPNEMGYMAQPLNVTRAKGPFLMPPLPELETEPDPIKLERLRALCQDPKVLFKTS